MIKTDHQPKIEIISTERVQYDLNFKIILIGDSSVGKTSLIAHAIKNYFDDKCQSTVAFDFAFFKIKINNTVIQLEIWDTCGFDKHRSLNNNYYHNASLAVIVYSINDEKSFDHVAEWIKGVKERSKPNAKIILVGNKSDLDDQRKIPTEFGLNYSIVNNYHKFFEASSVTGHNARNIFIEAAKVLFEDYENNKDDPDFSLRKSIKLNMIAFETPRGDEEKKKKKCFC